MHLRDNCRLCDLSAGNLKYGNIDKPFMESDDYFAVVSIGAFIEGWTLIVPKKHQLSCAPEFNKSKFLSFVLQVKKKVESTYGPSIAFEHGASTEGSLTGCGIDHAHLHIVPFDKSLEKELKSTNIKWTPYSSKESNGGQIKGDYLLYVDSIKNDSIGGLIAQPATPISQYFRKILAQKCGHGGSYDYKKHTFLESSSKSHASLAI